MKKKISLERLANLNLTKDGLSDFEFASQYARYGANNIVEREGHPGLELLVDTLKDPMIWFLLGIGATFYAVGEKQEALILAFATAPLLIMDAYLHWRTQASTSALQGQLAAESLVLRNGKEVQIDSRQIVPGDLVVLKAESHFLPADGYWEKVDALQVDESVLTGEAFPIAKQSTRMDLIRDGNERSVNTQQLGFAGTRVLTGQGLLRVLSTGKSTSYGEIVQSVTSISHERTGLQQSITHLTKILVIASAVFCLILAWVRLSQGHGWLDALLSAATLAVAAFPEEFPVVFTFFLGVGVYRLAKSRALVRRAVSVENIGRVTTVCTDKTGTITIGQLKLTHIDAFEKIGPGTKNEEELLVIAAAASNPEGSDPVDDAIFSVANERVLEIPSRTQVIPFTEDRRRETAFFLKDGRTFCAIKGAPEVILAKSNLSISERSEWLERTNSWARNGHKVLAAAVKVVPNIEGQNASEPEQEFQFSGLLAFEDPARPEVKSAIEYCKSQGIRVLMITGDHPHTASAIAKDVGLGGNRPVVVSAETDATKFEETWLKSHPDFLLQSDVIARCSPLQKLRIVEALKSAGELVAVTGDGVNDVPALKAADIGIAMGLRGSRSAKEVSSIILADDNFSTIVDAIREGRQLFTNLRLSFEYLLLIHIPFVLSAAIIPLLGFPILYLPAHIVWMELIIHPTALFAFQKSASAESFTQATRQRAFFTLEDWLRIGGTGLTVSIALVLIYIDVLHEDAGPEHGRAKALALLLTWSAGVVLMLTKGRLRSANFLAAASCLSILLGVNIEQLSTPLHLGEIAGDEWLTILGIVLVSLFLLGAWRTRYAVVPTIHDTL